jgi:hypothetical protein
VSPSKCVSTNTLWRRRDSHGRRGVNDNLAMRLVAVIERESTHLEADAFTRVKLRQILKATHFDAAVANVGSQPRPGNHSVSSSPRYTLLPTSCAITRPER